jgi:DNA modification methylase
MTQFISLSSIVVEPRQRREFSEEANQTLQSSIQHTGLLHALVLELIDKTYTLRAGERRLRAIRDLYELGGTFSYDGKPVPASQVPYTLWTDLTPLQRLEIEVDENNQREAFTWAERAAATATLSKLRSLQAQAAGVPLPTVAELAVEVRGTAAGSAHTDTRNDLILAQHLSDPEISKAKSAREAMGLLKKKEQAKRHEALGREVGKTFSGASHTCLNENSQAWLERQPDNLFDVILTDPPYGMNAHEFGEASDSTACAHEYEDTPEALAEIIKWFAPHSFRVAKPQAHLYLFLDFDWFSTWKLHLEDAGWKVFRTPVIWVKPTGFRTPWITQGPQRKYEMILYAVKGEKEVNFIGPDVINVTSPGEGLGHSAGKPAALFAELLRRSVKPGDSVFDPFCGTGPIFPAAHEMKCRATGIELAQSHYGIAVSRISKLK